MNSIFYMHSKIPANQKSKMHNTDRTAMTCNMRYSQSCKLIKPTKHIKKCIFMGHPPKHHESPC